MRRVLIGTLLAGLCFDQAAAQKLRDKETQQVVTEWVALPDAADLERVYPRPALKAGRGGKVTMTCAVLADGRLTNCAVVSETPVGQGFGEAALKLADRFRMREMLSDGSSPEGAAVNIPIIFKLD